MKEETAKALRAPFPDSAIGKLPRAGVELDFVGHAAVTDRVLDVDPEWVWEPYALDDDGLPKIVMRGKDAVLWIRLTVDGVTRPGVGIVAAQAFELEKQLISDALRNAAMRFGVALDLWTRQDLRDDVIELPPAEPTASKHDVDLLQACVEELEPDQRSAFLAWKNAQGFSWPWTVATYNALEAKLEEIVGAEVPEEQGEPGTAAASAPTVPVGVGSSPPSEATDTSTADVVSDPTPTLTDDLAAYSDEAF